jgi:hypothetical protein
MKDEVMVTVSLPDSTGATRTAAGGKDIELVPR